VSFHAEDDLLRILLFNIEDRARISAGEGDVLKILLADEGTVNLQRVEAATFLGSALDVSIDARVVPESFQLHANVPNPFNPSTSFVLDLPEATSYTVRIYNIAGQVVKTIAGQSEAGSYTLIWDGRSDQGSSVASGVYFYRVEAGEHTQTRKMLMLK